MKKLIISEDRDSRFFESKCTFGGDKDSWLYVRCAFSPDDNKSCTPDCAACHLDTANGMVDQYRCVRGDFTIGSIDK